MPSPEVHYCLEDNEGYMWLATDNEPEPVRRLCIQELQTREGLKHNVVFYLQKDPERAYLVLHAW
ncbi:MAG: hypothetical protein H6559_27690 [Lewinellaceae bacterium]|nr:hypothetical protein [Lewinellaceae bacterium]